MLCLEKFSNHFFVFGERENRLDPKQMSFRTSKGHSIKTHRLERVKICQKVMMEIHQMDGWLYCCASEAVYWMNQTVQ